MEQQIVLVLSGAVLVLVLERRLSKNWLAGLAVGVRGAEFETLPAAEVPVGMLAESPGIYSLRLSSREQRQFWAARQRTH